MEMILAPRAHEIEVLTDQMEMSVLWSPGIVFLREAHHRRSRMIQSAEGRCQNDEIYPSFVVGIEEYSVGRGFRRQTN